MTGSGPHLAVALEGAGWHPAAWREPDARPAELFTAGYWADLVREAEAGTLDFVTIEDALAVQSTRPDRPDDRIDQVRGRLDAVLIAARVAPLTRHIGLVPTVTVTHTEPFHVAKAIATLDYASAGRAGWRVRVSAHAHEAKHFGRREIDPNRVADLFEEATDYVEVVRRLWDSWEDDAEIRDAATGRFIDRDKLHYIDFESGWFRVKGPSIVPRPPQGQPLVTALRHPCADLVYITPSDVDSAASVARRFPPSTLVFADLVVFLDSTPSLAAARKARLDALDRAAFASDAATFTGTPAQLADLMLEWHAAGVAGFRLRPGAIPHDLTAITRALVPQLRRRGAFRHTYEADTLRGLLGLPRPTNRYSTVEGTR